MALEVYQIFDTMKEDLQRWIWKRCPSCGSEVQPNRPSAGVGGYQEHIILKCPDCEKSLKVVTDWSPTIDFPLVNEIPEMIQDEYCPYLSIQKKEEYILLKCCSHSPRECFGRPLETCYSYHKTRMDEALETGDYDTASLECETTIKLWKKEHPEEFFAMGINELVEIKRRILSRTDWIIWAEHRLEEFVDSEDFGSAASIAFTVAEISEEPRFWMRAAELYGKYVEKQNISLDTEKWFKKRKKRHNIVRAEIMRLEALSEIKQDERSELLRSAGKKWLELFRLSAHPFSHPDFLYYAHYLEDNALAEPRDAPSLYKKAHDFLISQLDKLEYPREISYYEGHAKYFLGLHYLTKTNYAKDEDEKISLLEKAVDVLTECTQLHEKIGVKGVRTNILIHCINSVLCIEHFKRTEDFDLAKEAKKHLDESRTYDMPHIIIETIDALTASLQKALSAVDNPKRALALIAEAKGKLRELVGLLPILSPRNVPIHKVLEETVDYLTVYLDSIQRNVTSFAGREVSYNNIKVSLDELRNFVERELYRAFKITETPNEEIGRSLIQAHLCGAFKQRKFQFREVQVAEGRSDSMLIMNEEKYPFEAKIWRGKEYYEKGFSQIKYYMTNENVQFGFYIIFDPRSRDYKSGGEEIGFNSGRIYQLFVHINPGKP